MLETVLLALADLPGKMDILIIGYGRVGQEIAKNLEKIKSVNKIFIKNLIKPKDLTGKKVFIEDISSVKIDYVIIAISAVPYNKWITLINEEKDLYSLIEKELSYNLPQIKKLENELSRLPEKTKIINVTNPSDAITNYLKNKIKNKVIGFGGELDAFRYEKETKKHTLCIGLHNKSMPILNLKSKEEIEKISSKISDKVLIQLRKEGMTHKITGKIFGEFFKKIISNKKSIIHFCYSLNEKPSFTKPFYVRNGEIQGEVPLILNDIEKKMLEKILKLL